LTIDAKKRPSFIGLEKDLEAIKLFIAPKETVVAPI